MNGNYHSSLLETVLMNLVYNLWGVINGSFKANTITVQSHSVLSCPVPSHSVPFRPILSSSVPFRPVLSHSVPFRPILSRSVLFRPIYFLLNGNLAHAWVGTFLERTNGTAHIRHPCNEVPIFGCQRCLMCWKMYNFKIKNRM